MMVERVHDNHIKGAVDGYLSIQITVFAVGIGLCLYAHASSPAFVEV